MDIHAHQDESRFRLVARRNRMIGLWAAQRLGKTGVDAESYAIEVMFEDLLEPGDDDIIAKIHSDFAKSGVDVPVAEIAAKLREIGDEARRQMTH
jgi:hypothetical protein